MDKLSLMFDAQQFAAAFGATRDDSGAARSEQDVMMWIGRTKGLASTGWVGAPLEAFPMELSINEKAVQVTAADDTHHDTQLGSDQSIRTLVSIA
jgi:hypothetical protein